MGPSGDVKTAQTVALLVNGTCARPECCLGCTSMAACDVWGVSLASQEPHFRRAVSMLDVLQPPLSLQLVYHDRRNVLKQALGGGHAYASGPATRIRNDTKPLAPWSAVRDAGSYIGILVFQHMSQSPKSHLHVIELLFSVGETPLEWLEDANELLRGYSQGM